MAKIQLRVETGRVKVQHPHRRHGSTFQGSHLLRLVRPSDISRDFNRVETDPTVSQIETDRDNSHGLSGRGILRCSGLLFDSSGRNHASRHVTRAGSFHGHTGGVTAQPFLGGRSTLGQSRSCFSRSIFLHNGLRFGLRSNSRNSKRRPGNLLHWMVCRPQVVRHIGSDHRLHIPLDLSRHLSEPLVGNISYCEKCSSHKKIERNL